MLDRLSTLIGGDAMYAAVLVGVFGSVFALLWGVRYLFEARTDPMRERIRRTVRRPKTGEVSTVDIASRDSGGSLLHSALAPLAKVARPSDAEELGRLRGRLSYAGYRSERAMITFLGAKMLLGLAVGGLVIWYNVARAEPLRFAALYTIIAIGAGFYLPNFWLSNRVKERQRKINHGLPDALDLMVTCVEAGLGLDAALNRVSEELRLSAPLLATELDQTALEMRAGMARGEAFRRLSNRTGVDELRNLAAIIIQTDIFGTSVARSLRVQAEAMRVRRMQLAEERAATVAVKLTVPLIFCILPSLFAVLMGPAVVKIIRVMLPRLTGGG